MEDSFEEEMYKDNADYSHSCEEDTYYQLPSVYSWDGYGDVDMFGEGDLREKIPCPCCDRSFVAEVLDRHKILCIRASERKRRLKARREMELASNIPLQRHLVRVQQRQVRIRNWRKHHNDFIDSISMLQKRSTDDSLGMSPVPTNTVIPPPMNQDLPKCETCGRRFNAFAYARHVTRCKEESIRRQREIRSLESRLSTIKKEAASSSRSNSPISISQTLSLGQRPVCSPQVLGLKVATPNRSSSTLSSGKRETSSSKASNVSQSVSSTSVTTRKTTTTSSPKCIPSSGKAVSEKKNHSNILPKVKALSTEVTKNQFLVKTNNYQTKVTQSEASANRQSTSNTNSETPKLRALLNKKVDTVPQASPTVGSRMQSSFVCWQDSKTVDESHTTLLESAGGDGTRSTSLSNNSPYPLQPTTFIPPQVKENTELSNIHSVMRVPQQPALQKNIESRYCCNLDVLPPPVDHLLENPKLLEPTEFGSIPTSDESSLCCNSSNVEVTLSRFCHECGQPYHSSFDKFCGQCGTRRLSID